jgi:hypothetical protein
VVGQAEEFCDLLVIASEENCEESENCNAIRRIQIDTSRRDHNVNTSN